MFWAIATLAGLFWLTGECDISGWLQLSIMLGGALGAAHVVYDYEELACTCDDPDHEH